MLKKVIIIMCSFILMFSISTSAYADIDSVKNLQENEDIKSIVEKYYDISYNSYLNLELDDMGSIIDTDYIWAKNFITVVKNNIEEIKYSKKQGYSTYSVKRLPIKIEIVTISKKDNIADVEVIIDGNTEEYYPLFVCFGKNNFKLINKEGSWKIISINNSEKLFKAMNEKEFKDLGIEDLHKKIDDMYSLEGERKVVINNEAREYPFEYHDYNNARIVKYANRFCRNRNTFFYNAGVDCTNFISQCISYGFGDTQSYSNNSSYKMVSGKWSAGSGGGFPAWENVISNWNYMLRNKYNQEG